MKKLVIYDFGTRNYHGNVWIYNGMIISAYLVRDSSDRVEILTSEDYPNR